MERIDAAVRSLEDSLSRLADRHRGARREVLQLFRARMGVDEIQARLAAARANVAIEAGWGDRHVEPVNGATMLVASVPADGGIPFQAAMDGVTEVLGDLGSSIPDGVEDA